MQEVRGGRRGRRGGAVRAPWGEVGKDDSWEQLGQPSPKARIWRRWGRRGDDRGRAF
jgi:hypothetical protein